ncbi:MAG: Lrp/AsnC ligand binding domain-containing protein [Candidatus Bathyarchaeia archaeon]|nr:Lrp/AsnC ligand binding domain-containing protein [Candidatus Bathyarchaeota archaeon]
MSKPSTSNPPLTAFTLIKIEGELEEAVRRLRSIPGVKYVKPVTGEYDLIAKLEVESKDDVRKCIDRMKEIDSVKGTLTLNVKPPIPKLYVDVESKIRDVIGETGTVESKYGGYDIAVLDESMFPWPTILKLLLEYQFEIWITQSEGRILISCKPPPI